MADQHENKSATSPTSTPLLSPTTSFVSSHTLAERPSFEIAERSQGVPFQTHCQQVSPDSSENAIPTEDRRPDLLQASNSVEPGRPNINPPIFLLTSNVASGAPEDPSSLVSSPPALHKVRVLSQQSTHHTSNQITIATFSRHASVTYSEICSSVLWKRCMIHLSTKMQPGH